MATRNLLHLVLRTPPEAIRYTSPPQRGLQRLIPKRDPRSHSAFLQTRLQQAWQEAEHEQVVAYASRSGIYLEFRSDPGVALITKSLEDMGSRQVRLLNVRKETELIPDEATGESKEQTITYATVYVAKANVQYLAKKLEEYAEKTRASSNPQNADLVNSIADLRKALLIESFWQDARELVPAEQPEWCEAWLKDDTAVVERFDKLLAAQEIEAKPGFIRFPERVVKLIHANRSQLEQLSRLSDDIAEYRRAKDTASFWTELPNREQADWASSLLERIQIDDGSQVSVCLLDTGVNNGHPLLVPILADPDCQAVDLAWGAYDHDKHGTLMAGVAGFGDLIEHLSSNDTVEVRHRLESVKILPPSGQNEPELWGLVTAQGVSLAEIQAPERRRIICMPVTTTDTRDRGRPSSWSGELDQLASGAQDDTRRLIIVSAGNPTESIRAERYPEAQITDSVHDPAQAWNALTVGAYTALDIINDPTLAGYQPIAPKDGLSPFTTTSLLWEDKWPIKPEIMLEGGNMAHNGAGFATECDDLSLLSTYYQPQVASFYPFRMTSAATAHAAWLAAQILAKYPHFWPETIRALMVHSAEWPVALRQQFLGSDTKTAMKRLLRICGYGVPALERAIYSATNSLTLIAQAELQPFDKKEKGSGYRTKDMHLYDLPWPKEVLLSLPDGTNVQMRVTLSYFVEPGPGEIGWQDRYRYASHALRFDLNSPGEAQEDFVKRINTAARDEDEGHPGTQSASDHWVIGSQTRDKGSVHSDIWRGTAAQLAASNLIAISPTVGWWRERAHLGKWNRSTRYALIVSIITPDETVDVYTPVAVQIGIPVPVVIQT